MTLAQVQIAIAFIVALIATWGGLLTATALLFPTHTKRAEYALETDPKKCFLKGLGVVVLFIFGLLAFQLPFGGLPGLAITLTALSMAVLGGAGTAHLMGRRISEMSERRTSFFSLVSGSIIYSLAIGFPYVGWFLFAPVSLIFSAGAGLTALMPRRHVDTPPVYPTPSYDLN